MFRCWWWCWWRWCCRCWKVKNMLVLYSHIFHVTIFRNGHTLLKWNSSFVFYVKVRIFIKLWFQCVFSMGIPWCSIFSSIFNDLLRSTKFLNIQIKFIGRLHNWLSVPSQVACLNTTKKNMNIMALPASLSEVYFCWFSLQMFTYIQSRIGMEGKIYFYYVFSWP